MARTTIAQAIVHLTDWVRYMHDGMLSGWTGTIANIRTALTNLETDRPRAIGAGIRAGMQSAWQSGAAAGADVLADLARASAVNAPAGLDIKGTFAWLRDYFADEGAFNGGSVDQYFTCLLYTSPSPRDS